MVWRYDMVWTVVCRGGGMEGCDAFAQGYIMQSGPAWCGSLSGAPVAVLHDRWGNGVLGASREVLGVPGGSEDFRGCSPELGKLEHTWAKPNNG